MARHEAAEGLAALCVGQAGGMEEAILQLLQHMRDDSCQEVAETCAFAADRLCLQRQQQQQQQHEQKRHACKSGESQATCHYVSSAEQYVSVHPAPPLGSSEATSISHLRAQLLDTTGKTLSLFERYRAMFSLRNLGGPLAGPTTCPCSTLLYLLPLPALS